MFFYSQGTHSRLTTDQRRRVQRLVKSKQKGSRSVAHLQVQILRKRVIVYKNHSGLFFPVEAALFLRPGVDVLVFDEVAVEEIVVSVFVAVPLHDFLEVDVHVLGVLAGSRLDLDAH